MIQAPEVVTLARVEPAVIHLEADSSYEGITVTTQRVERRLSAVLAADVAGGVQPADGSR